MTLPRLRSAALVAAVLLAAGCVHRTAVPARAAVASAAVAPPTAAQFEPEIAQFEAADRLHMPPSGGIEFAGSSSFRFWSDLASDFPGLPVFNRGFGGSTFPDLIFFARRIVLPYRPRVIVLYEGDNDIAAGRTPEQVRDDYDAFARLVHDSLPGTRLVFVSIKPSPIRWSMADRMRVANSLVAAAVAQDPLARYVDVFGPMLGANGRPRPELFRDDSLHMTAAGYAIWRERIGPVIR